MRMIKKVVKVGNNSLMVIIDSDVVGKMKIEEGDRLVVDIVRRLKDEVEEEDGG